MLGLEQLSSGDRKVVALARGVSRRHFLHPLAHAGAFDPPERPARRRLDDDTRQSIEHGRRIRACLGQAELSLVSVLAQIAILLALNAGLFDSVPLSRMVAAQQAVQAAADTLSDDMVERLTQGDELTPADRKQVTEAARGSIATFLAQAAQAPAT